jgi:hypothetical protein
MTSSPTRQLKKSEAFAVPSRSRGAVRSLRQGFAAGRRGAFAGGERVAISPTQLRAPNRGVTAGRCADSR